MKDILSEQSKSEALPAPSQSGEIRNILISEIMPSEMNKYGIREIEELAASIEEIGLLHNLVVLEKGESRKYELISGERRFEACKMLFLGGNMDFKTVPCKVERSISSEIDELKLIHANATARELTDYEKTMQAARIKDIVKKLKNNGHEFKGRTRDIVADMLNVSPAQVGRMESINKNLSPELKEEFKDGKIGITAAYETSMLEKEEQTAVYEDFKATGEIAKAKPKKGEKTAENPPAINIFSEEKPAALLIDKDLKEYQIEGDIVMIAAVNAGSRKIEGIFSSETHEGTAHYIELARAVVQECLKKAGWNEQNLKIMKGVLTDFWDSTNLLNRPKKRGN